MQGNRHVLDAWSYYVLNTYFPQFSIVCNSCCLAFHLVMITLGRLLPPFADNLAGFPLKNTMFRMFTMFTLFTVNIFDLLKTLTANEARWPIPATGSPGQEVNTCHWI